jgi:hypothetical protein
MHRAINAFVKEYYYGKEDPGDNAVVEGVAYPLYFRKFVLSGTTE